MFQDVSRLVDICRHSIYFETIDGVKQCLAAINQDKDITLVLLLAIFPLHHFVSFRSHAL